MPTTKGNTSITVADSRGLAPVVERRLFQLERGFDPVLVNSSAPTRTRVLLNLPDNGAHRDGRGPGIYRTGNITKIIHADGCAFPVTRCRGECTTLRVVEP